MCERNSRLGQFRIITGQPPAGVIIVYSVLMIIFIIINKPSFKYNFKNYCKMHSLVNKAINCIIAVMLVVLVLNMRYKPYNGLQINMLDVGQGDSIYVSASGRHNFCLTVEVRILKVQDSTGCILHCVRWAVNI